MSETSRKGCSSTSLTTDVDQICEGMRFERNGKPEPTAAKYRDTLLFRIIEDYWSPWKLVCNQEWTA